jgi:Fe-S oxidoreductase
LASEARLAWIDSSLDVNGGGDTLLFVGCLSLFDSILGDSSRLAFAEMARSAVRILNKLGISPIILKDERCCGRDLFDIGDRDAFRALARHNLEAIEASGAKTVVTICPECAFTLRDTYAKEVGELAFDVPFTVRHISELAAEHMDRLSFERGEEKLALHDPCYLCRYLGVTDAPRSLLGALVSTPPIELEEQGAATPCCGAGSWVNHGPHTRTAVGERLKEAHRCGAEALVTACPKCTLLYAEVSPEGSWKQSPVVVRALITLAAARLK